jgi:transposase
VLVSKYADHQPLYRQSEIYAREGVDLDRSTLAGWVGATSELLAPLVEAVRDHVLSASKLHADDTPVPVLAPGNGKTKIGRLWTNVRDDRPSGDTTAPAVWFAYSPDRKGERPRQHLKLYRGALQADAYAGFHHLYEGGTIFEVACWAHARREFHEIHIAHASTITSEAIERIASLYAIEAEIRGSTPEIRKTIRQARARPLLDNMRTWLDATLAKLSRKSDTAAAIRYALSRWCALTRYVHNGQLEIDNHATERANASPTSPSTTSASCFLGTCRHPTTTHPHSLRIHIKLCGYITLTLIHKNGPHHTLTLNLYCIRLNLSPHKVEFL